MSLVLREDAGAVATLTLNRPDKLNALSPELIMELRAHVDAIATVPDTIRCVVLRGAGRSFCAGADMQALKDGVVTADPELRSKTVERLGALPQAVIAAVHGHCYTGGMELALAADLVVAATNTKFCDTHAKIGIVPRWGLSARLPSRVGLATALKLSLTSEPIDADEALRIRLCDYVVPDGELEAFALGRAAAIAANVPASIRAIKHLYAHNLNLPIAEALEYERRFTPVTKPRDE